VAAASPFFHQPASAGAIAKYAIAFFWGTLEWSYFPFFPWFAYVLAGYAFRLFLKQTIWGAKLDIQNQFIYFIPLWIGVVITLPYASSITHNLEGPNGYYHHGILFFGWVILFMISYVALVKLVEISWGDQRIVVMIKWIGQKVTSLYVIQWLIIGNLATWLYKSQNLFQFAAWFAGITLATVVMGWLLEKTKRKWYF
jgi:hypothetical protein